MSFAIKPFVPDNNFMLFFQDIDLQSIKTIRAFLSH